MKTLLFTALLGAFLGVAWGAATCDFDIYSGGESPCENKTDRFPIPCVSQCASYYQCDENLIPVKQQCRGDQQFKADNLECDSKTNVNCSWFLKPVPEPEPEPEPKPTTGDITTPEPGGNITTTTNGPNSTAEPPSKGLHWAWILLIVILVIVLLGGVGYFVRRNCC